MTVPETAVEIPYGDLSDQALRSLLQEFVTRDGTDYGAVEKSLEEKVARLMGQLETNRAKIYFDTETETINIVASHDGS